MKSMQLVCFNCMYFDMGFAIFEGFEMVDSQIVFPKFIMSGLCFINDFEHKRCIGVVNKLRVHGVAKIDAFKLELVSNNGVPLKILFKWL